MRCSKCGTNNREAARFCDSCGAPRVTTCAKCGAAKQSGEKFCRECRAALQITAAALTTPDAFALTGKAALQPIATNRPPEGERKMITALFADIKGSTELMRELDPEEASAIIDPVLQLMMDAVHRYDGYTAQASGDGIFAMFGAPVAHEDHPQRALHAALAIQHELESYREHLREQALPPVEARIGINTGEVVLRIVKTGGHTEYSPVGHATNLAARMQTIAPAGGIVITEESRRLVEGYFTLRELGSKHVKGINESITVYQVMGVSTLRGHFELAARRGLTTFVGRKREIAELRRALDFVVGGRGQIVAVRAEAGTGKSRLFYEFKATLPARCRVLEAYSVSHGRASPWLPVLELLRGYFNLQGAEDAAARRDKIWGSLMALDPILGNTLPYLWNLLAIQKEPDPLVQMDAQIKRQRTLDAIKRIILAQSQREPTIVIFEDLHWVDDPTQELLDLLADSIANERVLLLVNYRPEYQHKWSNKSHYSQIPLDALDEQGAQEMLTALLGNGDELAALKQFVMKRTEGNPFFVEEMVRALFEQGILVRDGVVKVARHPHDAHLPITVQGMIAARIDRLPAGEKGLLRALAAIGKEFPLQLVQRVCHGQEEQLPVMLQNLQSAGFIYEDPAATEEKYHFKHSLIHEVAYRSLLRQSRKILHGSIGAQIEALFEGQLDDHLGELAHHYSRSENSEKAIEYLYLTGKQAARRSANAAAVHDLTAAIELLKAVPETAERDQRELTMQTTLGPALMAIKGHACPEIEKVYTRALELCRRLGEVPEIFPVLSALSRFYFQRGELRKSLELAQNCLQLAPNIPERGLLVEGHRLVGMNFMHLGSLARAREHLEQGLRFYDSASHDWAQFYGSDPEIVSLCYLSNLIWLLGYPDQALRKSTDLIALARARGHYPSLAGTWHFVAFVHQARGEPQQCQSCAEEGIALSAEQGFTLFSALSTIDHGWAICEQVRKASGIALMREGIAAYRGVGGRVFLPCFLGLLAGIYVQNGRLGEASELLNEAFAESERSSAHWWDAELHRTRGHLLLRDDGAPGARASFLDAINIARHQGSKSLELRATTSLARLLRATNQHGEAQAALTEIYNWFTEGFDTADLKEAKALLDELTG